MDGIPFYIVVQPRLFEPFGLHVDMINFGQLSTMMAQCSFEFNCANAHADMINVMYLDIYY
jgi:hypothetical protein